MVFRRINSTTVNCIISKKDLQDNGIRVDDILLQKKDALQNLQDAVRRVAVQENFELNEHYASLELAIRRDDSLSLTLSQDINLPQAFMNQAGKELFGASKASFPQNSSTQEESKSNPPAENIQPNAQYHFSGMSEVIRAAKAVRDEDAAAVESTLYQEPDGSYLLHISAASEDVKPAAARIFILLSELTTDAAGTANEIAYIKEHGNCILKENALQILKKA